MALLFAVLTFGSQADAQTPAPTPTPESTDTPKPQKQEELPPGPVRNLSISPAHGQIEVTWDAPPLPLYGPGASYYRYKHRASGGSWSSWKNISRTSATIGSLVNGQRYQVQVLACNSVGCSGASSVYGAPVAPTATPTNTPVPLPDPPTRLRISLDTDNNARIVVSYRRSESPHYYEFELHGSSSRNGSYSKAATDSDSSSPAYFSNLTRGRWYKARGRNCIDSSRRSCGDWSAFTSAIELPNIIGNPTATPTRVPIGIASATATATHTPTHPPAATAGCRMTDLGYISVSKTEVHRHRWTTDDCKSANRKKDHKDSYSRYYGFSLTREADVAITLTSVQDTYLYLLDGIGVGGGVKHQNDDIDWDARNLNSRISETLPAGSYTIEATTYGQRTTGNFALKVQSAILASSVIPSSSSHSWPAITRWTPLPPVQINLSASHDWYSETIGGTKYNAFRRHSNRWEIQNYVALKQVRGVPIGPSAKTEVYVNNRKGL